MNGSKLVTSCPFNCSLQNIFISPVVNHPRMQPHFAMFLILQACVTKSLGSSFGVSSELWLSYLALPLLGHQLAQIRFRNNQQSSFSDNLIRQFDQTTSFGYENAISFLALLLYKLFWKKSVKITVNCVVKNSFKLLMSKIKYQVN